MDKLLAFTWISMLIAMSGDLFVSVVLPFGYRGYSRMKDSISALGNPESPVRIPFNIWMLIEGILFLLPLPAFFLYYRSVSPGLAVTAVVFIAVFAVGACILTCFFSVNKDRNIVTTASKIHGIGSVTGFMLFLFVPVLLSVLSFKNGEIFLGVTSVISFILALITFILFVMSDKPEFSKSFIANEGLWQRLNLLFMYIPLFAAATVRLAESLDL